MSRLADYFAAQQTPVIGFERLYARVMREIGLDSSSWNPENYQVELICDYMTERLEKAYQTDWWPVLCPTVARAVQEDDGKFVPWVQVPEMTSQIVVTGGGEAAANGIYAPVNMVNGYLVYHFANYQIRHTGTQWNLELSNLQSNFYRNVTMNTNPAMGTWEQAWVGAPLPVPQVGNLFANAGSYEPMDAIENVLLSDPALGAGAKRVAYRLSWRGIELPVDAPGTVWVRFRLRPPRVTKQAYSASTVYHLDDVVLQGGHCYRSLQDNNLGQPVSNENWWERQFIPAMFTRYVAKAVLADWQRRFGDNQETADRESARAQAELERLSDLMVPAQRQMDRVRAMSI